MSQLQLLAVNVPTWNERNKTLLPQTSNLILSSSNQCMDTTEVQNTDKILNPSENLKTVEKLNGPQMRREDTFTKQLESVPLDNYDGIHPHTKHLIPLKQVT